MKLKHLKDMETFLKESYNIDDVNPQQEQDYRIQKDEENPQRFQYMMLDRLKSDCEYFLNYGKGSLKHLYYGNIEEHISEMKKLWNMLNIKPEWLSYEQILDYEKRMLNYSQE